MQIHAFLGFTLLVVSLQPSGCHGRATNITTPQSSIPICRAISDDKDFPSPSIWKSQLPNVEMSQGMTAGDYRLRAKNVADVQAAIKFARAHNVRLTTICSGHDWLDRSSARSGLLLDISRMLSLQLLDSFVPNQAPLGDTGKVQTFASKTPQYARIGAGWGVQPLNIQLNASGVYANGGIIHDICVAGGWSLYGGHGLTSNTDGLGVDDIVEFEAVTTTGELVVANLQVNKDIFWAMRGGGPMAIRTSVTVRVRETPKVTYTAWGFNTTWQQAAHPGNFWTAMEFFHRQLPSMIDAGVSGYYYIFPTGTSTMRLITHGANSSIANSRSILDPIFRQMEAIIGLSTIPANYTEYASWADFYIRQFGVALAVANTTSPPQRPPVSGGRVYSDSIIMSLEDTQKQGLGTALAEAIPKFGAGQYKGHLVCGPAVWQIDAKGTSVSPSWRDNCATELLATGNLDGSQTMDYLREFLGKSGTYINEASYTQQNWKTAFWGDNYPRLEQLQERFDFDGLLWSTPSVGADRYQVDFLGRVCQSSSSSSLLTPLGDNMTFPTVVVSGNLPAQQ